MCVLRRAGRPGGNEGRSNVHPRQPRAFRYMMGIQAAGVVCRPFLCRDATARRGRIEGEHSAVPVAWFPSKSERSVAMDESSPCVTSRSDHRCASLFWLILLLIFLVQPGFNGRLCGFLRAPWPAKNAGKKRGSGFASTSPSPPIPSFFLSMRCIGQCGAPSAEKRTSCP
jgi:hypothetical protein